MQVQNSPSISIFATRDPQVRFIVKVIFTTFISYTTYKYLKLMVYTERTIRSKLRISKQAFLFC